MENDMNAAGKIYDLEEKEYLFGEATAFMKMFASMLEKSTR